MDLYRTALHSACTTTAPPQPEPLPQVWPVLRELVGRTIRTVREDAFAGGSWRM
ncbi:hypothetical protein [Streptomyces sp. NPDC127190]|uniref:hypothetical protein n=1 Tax=unclassified Streptomyces TaxID=2593676 RepID=UPI003633A857